MAWSRPTVVDQDQVFDYALLRGMVVTFSVREGGGGIGLVAREKGARTAFLFYFFPFFAKVFLTLALLIAAGMSQRLSVHLVCCARSSSVER